MHPYHRDFSLSAATAGFVAVLVGFTSSVAIVFQAAQALGATPAQLASWIWALGLGMGLCTLVPSLILRQPVMVAWSTPGAAVLATAAAAGGYTLAQGVGAFMACAAAIAGAVADAVHREAAVVTFLVTLSGLTLGGVGSAFWGVVAGLLVWAAQAVRTRGARA